MNLKLQNIYNRGRKIWLFERVNKQLKITEVNNFYPYFFEPDPKGQFKGYGGKQLKKVTINEPNQIAKSRSGESYESDVLFTKRFLIDCVEQIEKTDPRYLFLDIEIIAKELPRTGEAPYPVSCITVYDSYEPGFKTWYLPDYTDEKQMLGSFVEYLKDVQPDMLLAWNIEFDYNYLANRIKNFGQEISPISEVRYGKDDTKYPAGISIVDYKGLYEKLTLGKKRSYALDYVAQDDLGETAWGVSDFGVINEHIKSKNINDVRRMVKLEEKYNIIGLFNNMRTFSKCFWEDLPTEHIMRDGKLETVSNNSKIIDMLVLQEAKRRGCVLPKKGVDNEEFEFQGAFRESYECGHFKQLGKYDLSGAYLRAITGLCLDSENIVATPSKDTIDVEVTDRITQNVVTTYHVKQNPEALLVSVVRNLLTERDLYRNLLKNTPETDPDYDLIEQQYKAIKTISLSAWGIFGNKYFRLYDYRIASMITSIIRDLLHYVKDNLELKGYKIVYIDTDSVFATDGGEDLTGLLNRLIDEWSYSKFNKPSEITFEAEGRFDSIVILSKCRYYGMLRGKGGVRKEIKGIEAKKINSSQFESRFQEELLKRILDNQPKTTVTDWVIDQQRQIKTQPLLSVAYPCKIKNQTYEKTTPIFVRAYNNTKSLFKDFRIGNGELFYYVYTNPLNDDEQGKPRDVFATSAEFDVIEKSHGTIKINWEEMTRRSIVSKAEEIFEAMKWGNINHILNGQVSLF